MKKGEIGGILRNRSESLMLLQQNNVQHCNRGAPRQEIAEM